MPLLDVPAPTGSLLAGLLSDDVFRPAEPRSLTETGLSASLIEGLALKYVGVTGNACGRGIAEHLCLPFGVLEGILQTLRTKQLIVHTSAAPLNDYYYALTDHGRARAKTEMQACAYVGPAPTPLEDYFISVEAQTVRAEAPKRRQLAKAFEGVSIDPVLFDQLGPAVNSGAGLFLYGSPGNGKTTLARRITRCFGQHIWLPRTLIEDGQLIKLFDSAYHEPMEGSEGTLLKAAEHDRRWVKIRRPTVVVGGELTLESLEIRHDPHTNTSEAPLQLKSNCGCLLIDDFGRQRIQPQELLNRWIVPLENRVDYLTIATGKKIAAPFEQLIIFSTNLDPAQLTDEAFLRRIPYKIEVGDPSEREFQDLFKMFARTFGFEHKPEAIEYLISRHYRPHARPMRRCHARDLLSQVRDYCAYNELPLEMRPEYFDRVVRSYFTMAEVR